MPIKPPNRSRAVLMALAAGLIATPWFVTGPATLAKSLPVAQGAGSEIQAATVFGNTPATTPVTVSVVLKTVHTAQLKTFVQSLSNSGPKSHQFLSARQFAKEFGQPNPVIHQLVHYFRRYGISTKVAPNHLDIVLNGTAGAFDQAFSVNLENMALHGKHFHGTKKAPTVPQTVASPILAVLGLTNYTSFSSNAMKPMVRPASTSAIPGYTPSYVANTYDVTPLYQAGDLGQGETLGIVTLASFTPSDAYGFWRQMKIATQPNRIQTIPVDGGSGAPTLASGSDETTLDVEQSGALAPDANIRVYEAPNTDYGFFDAFNTAISQNHVDTLSCSWGESETAVNQSIAAGQESPNYGQAFNEIFMEAAAQGQSLFAASGDRGAYDAIGDAQTTNLAVDQPADSPYITAAGGTTAPGVQNYGPLGTVDVPATRTWGWDYLWPVLENLTGLSESQVAESFVAGSGGGYSTAYSTPWYQKGVKGVSTFEAVPYLTPVSNNTAWTFNPAPSVVTGSAKGRAVPDIAMNADPQTGYAVYSPSLFPAAYGSNWAQYGGTSFVAPQLAGLGALIDQAARGRVGLWNGAIYQFAQTLNSPFTPLDQTGTANDNLYYTGTANAIFNPGSGLGTPNIAKLAADFSGVKGHKKSSKGK